MATPPDLQAVLRKARGGVGIGGAGLFRALEMLKAITGGQSKTGVEAAPPMPSREADAEARAKQLRQRRQAAMSAQPNDRSGTLLTGLRGLNQPADVVRPTLLGR